MAETQNNDFNHPILNLTPQEKTAYSYLFKLADTDALGVLTGERAVTFFEKTRVPAPVLGEIWQIADTENRGLLTKPGFCMVLRLIGCYQAGEQPRTELAFKAGPIPKFDGITVPGIDGAAVPAAQPASPTRGQMPPNALQPQLSGQSSGAGPIRIPPLDPAKVQQYSSLFDKSGAQGGMLDGGTAKSIFERSGLPNEMLGKIWMLSDREQRGSLDQTDFIVAMHLLTSMKTRAMTALPATLPPGLFEAAARRGQRPPSRQLSGAAASGVARQFTGSQPARAQSPLAQSTPPPLAAAGTGPHWLVTAQDKTSYDRFFNTIDTSGTGIISGEQAVRFFSDSRLSEDTLASIWDLADINSEGQLNRDEFAVAMYLIRQQRQPNAPPLPAFLPPALIPPSMRGQAQQASHSTAPSFDNPAAAPPSNVPKSAAEDLFGLDEPSQVSSPVIQPQTTGASASRDPFSGDTPSSPGSPQRFQPQATGTSFKPFVPTSAFGASLASQNTGGSMNSNQASRSIPQQPQPQPVPQQASAGMDDLLGDSETNAKESSRLTNETTELANMSNQIGNLRTQMEQTQNKKVATQADLTATNNQKRDLEVRLQQFRTQYESEVRAVKELEQQLAASKESTKKLGQDLAMLEGTQQDLQTQHTQVSQALAADQQENATLKQKIAQINAEVTRLKPEIEKLKMDARQQKGLVSINKKQLSTNEGERDRLQTEKSDLEREAAEQARSAAASPEVTREIASPAPSTKSSTNPFFRNQTGPSVASPPAPTSSGPTPTAFDTLFGPSSAFAPGGQASSRSGTPPATSFIGRNLPSASGAAGAVGGVIAGGLAAAGATSMVDSMSSAGEATPSATPPTGGSVKDGPSDANVSTPAQEPPPPPPSRQITASNLPITALQSGEGSETATSVDAVPPTSRAGEVDTPTPAAPEKETIPGAFPGEDGQPSTVAQEVATPTPGKDDFDSAFANFGEGAASREIEGGNDPFGQSGSQATSQGPGLFNSEFPPIQSLERDDDSDSDSEGDGFDDNFTGSSPARGTEAAGAAATSVSAFAPAPTSSQQPPSVEEQNRPPTYEQSPPPGHIGTGERSESNQFPPEFTGLLPAREDPTSPPPPAGAPPAEGNPAFASQQETTSTTVPSSGTNIQSAELTAPEQDFSLATPASQTTEIFHDAASRPLSSVTATGTAATQQPPAAAPKNAFDEFDEFDDLAEAKEADKTTSDGFDMDFGRQSVDEFNPAFDSPAASMTNTPFASRSVQQSQDSTANGFANFTPNVSTSSAFASGSDSQAGSIQQTPQGAQHDWDAIFSGLDSSKDVDTTFQSSNDPWGTAASTGGAATTNGTSAAANLFASSTTTTTAAQQSSSPLGRAITPGTEHDDPILKRLTGMGYARADALRSLEMHDYDINRAVDHLTST